MDLPPAPARWRRFTIGRLMLVVAALAVALKLYVTIGAGSGNLLVALILSALAARAILANPPGSPVRRRAVSWTRACLAVYLPCGLGLLMDCTHCIGVWLQVWPIVPGALPGLMACRFVFGHIRSDPVEWLISAGFALALIALVARLGRRGGRWMAASLVVAALYSTFAVLAISSLIRS